jgi:hypothetical protein
MAKHAHTPSHHSPERTPIDFNAMATVTDHRDAGLLDDLARLTELQDQIEIARRRGKTAYGRVLRANCHECVEVEAKVAATAAFTSEGRRAKALHALREADPDAPSGGFSGFNAVVFSALFDIVQAGAL